ncbi:Tat pathway signal protein [Catellatospora chokoriensis]|uniref:Tat pathway signal protein n=1 Tax=Catellatospora chokoriensis TaxID=310353 RepID=A0A8J3KGH9_9ACTN|nr:Tat pathway signal protein [Catellatospora chokoriensis]GIF94629.1 Tat pathway signal protein [Catellatospora chokoriensis]
MGRAGRTRNDKLVALIDASGWSYDACAAAIRAVATEVGENLASCNRSHIAKWIIGVQPSGRTPHIIAEAFSRRLGHIVSPPDLGFEVSHDTIAQIHGPDWWRRDPITDLVTVGKADLERRDFAVTALYSLAALAVPLQAWQEIAERGRRARREGGAIGEGELESVREMIGVLSRADERFGGGSGRSAAIIYLTTDVAAYLRGSFTTDATRAQMFSAAAELAYLVGWKAFDAGEHGLAQTYYLRALRLANDAGDGPLGGFILRAMAHQAVDLGHGQASLQLAESSLEWSRVNGTPGATALFTVVKARGHAAQRQRRDAVTTMIEAERLLAHVDWDNEPIWIHRLGFGEPSLANQTALSLRDLGDLNEAERQFRRSVATRNGGAHRRIHALTLANLADIEFTRGEIAGACMHWNKALDDMSGLRSARATEAVRNARRRLATLGQRMPADARQVDRRSADYLNDSRSQ